MKNKTFEKYFPHRGDLKKASRDSGIPYVTLIQHANNLRRVAPESAVKYEALLGIPRWELRPDVWPPPQD